MQTTFTVLVTLEHDEGQGHSQSRIAELIQQALEEGTRDYAGFPSAQVDAFKGVRLTTATLAGSDLERYKRIAPLHNARVPA